MEEQHEADQYGFKKQQANQAQGSVHWYLLPLMLVFRPGRFMLSWGIHANIAWILITAWIVGAGRMTSPVVNRQRFSAEPLPIRIEAWPTLFGIVFVLGFLWAFLEYGLGGAWTCLRLRICGVRGSQWHRSTRIYLFARLVEMAPLLVLLMYFSAKHADVRSYINQPVGWANILTGAFLFISPVIAYLSVLACYRTKTVWTIILFLIWPLCWRVAVIGWAMLYSNLANPYLGSQPDIQNPVAAASSALKFDHPSDWSASIADPSSSNLIEAFVVSENEEASLVVRVQPRDEVDLIEYDLAVLKDLGYTITSQTPAPNIRFEQQRGDGAEYNMRADDHRQYKVLHLLVHFDVNHDVLFRFMATERYWNSALAGWKQILDSLEISDLYKIDPDIVSPMGIDREVYSFEAPGNWHLNESQHEPFTNLELSAKQYSWFTTTIIDRDMTAQAELDMYLNHVIDDQLVFHSKLTKWMGLEGIGAQGQLRESLAGFQQFKAFYVPLADGRVLAIHQYQAESSADLTDPGFELIESTFKLLVEPTEVDP